MLKLRNLLPLSLLFLFVAGAVADDAVVAISAPAMSIVSFFILLFPRQAALIVEAL